MASIIPATPALPGPVNATTSYDQLTSFLLAQGSYLRLLNQGSVLNFGAESFVNRGTIFNDIDADYAGVTRTAPNGTIRTVENSGTIVYRGLDTRASAVQVFDEITSLTNSGQIFALASGGYARAIQSFVTDFKATNSGLIAAQSANALAVGIVLPNGGNIVNTASGRIVAEGVTAIAVDIQISSLSGIEVDNAGHIEGRSNTEGKLGVGVWMAFGDIVNSGTIAGDVGITGNGIWVNRGLITGTVSAISGSEFFTLTNEAAGVVRGQVFGGTRDDVITSAGLIDGSMAMDGGDDRITLTGSGAITGTVDLGLGNDRYTGGTGVDRVAGDNGDDVIDGQGGNDLLLGGNGNDLITGGAGADGLYGEQGDDRLVTSGADVAWGGAGDDRIEAGDLAFAAIDGGIGIDTLVLPARAAALDVSAALASGRIVGIERLSLTAGSATVVHAADLAAFAPTGGDVRIEGAAGARLELVGAWSNAGAVTIDGAAFTRWTTAGGGSVVVAQAVTVAVVATATAGATGLDPVAAGGPAPVPGAESGLDFTPNALFVSNFEVFEPTTIAASELWFTTGAAPAVQSFRDSAALTVLGALQAANQAQATAVAVQFTNLGRVTVGTAGAIVAESYGPIARPVPDYFPISREGAYAIRDAFRVDNAGYISAYASSGVAVAMGELGVAPPFPPIPAVYTAAAGVPIVTNSGAIDALSATGWAAGVVGTIDLTNSGTIAVTGAKGAIAVFGERAIANTGTIQATSGAGTAIAILLAGGSGDSYPITNSGLIAGTQAILIDPAAFGTRALVLANDGTIRGAVTAAGGADTVTNRGRIEGEVALGAGNDRFDGAAGTQTGRIDGGAGNDVLIGGAGDDRLAGGTGNDTIDGGAGNDTAIFAGARGDYTVAFVGSDVILTSATQGTDRVTGVERFAFASGTLTLDELRLPAAPPFYLLVPAGGSATVQGTGSVFGQVGTAQEVVVRDLPGRIALDASFNAGGDRIVLPGAASAWTIRRSGATVDLSDGDTQVSVPAGIAGVTLQFADGSRLLKIDPATGLVTVNTQAIDSLETTIGTGPQSPATTDPVSANVASALLVTTGGDAVASGRLTVFGTTAGAETVTIAQGARVTFDASYNAGGDTIVLSGMAGFWSASRSGATVTLTFGETLLTVPAGIAGATLRFADGDRTLAIDPASGAVRIGGQAIGTTAQPLETMPVAGVFGEDSMMIPASHAEDAARSDLVAFAIA